MKNDLPYLNQERLNIIFNHVYDIVDIDDDTPGFTEEKLSHLLDMLKSMQLFNYHHRPSDTHEIFHLCNGTLDFEINSEGTTLWLALILAIKDLYGFSDKKLVTVIKQISIRK